LNLKKHLDKLYIAAAFAVGVGILAPAIPGLANPWSLPFAAPASNGFTYQGRLTLANGQPVANGTYSITLKLYDAATGGNLLATYNDPAVVVNGGLFTTVPNNFRFYFDGRDLYIGVTVGADPELTPRQQITAVPMAHTLTAGAVISGALSSNQAILTVNNSSGGNGNGLVVNGVSTIADPTNATVLVTNSAGGTALRVQGSGVIQSTGRSRFFVAGFPAFNDDAANPLTITTEDECSKIAVNGATTSGAVLVPVTLPGVEFGQAVSVESMTVYYRAKNNGKISTTHLSVKDATPSGGDVNVTGFSNIIISSVDHGNTDGSGDAYVVPAFSPASALLSESKGPMFVYMDIAVPGTGQVFLCGFQITLKHF
jgi:hypothetical protein